MHMLLEGLEMNDNVIHADFQRRHEAENEMVTAIKDVIYSFAGRMSVASMFGVIEVVKNDMVKEQLDA